MDVRGEMMSYDQGIIVGADTSSTSNECSCDLSNWIPNLAGGVDVI